MKFRSVCARRAKGRRSVGFTLVELLVVVAIIALLISILLPSLQQAREAGFSVKCMANEKSFGNAVALYQNEYNQMFPYGMEASAREVKNGAGIGGSKPPQQLVFKYTKGVGIFQDPKAPTGNQHYYNWFVFWDHPDVPTDAVSYMFSEQALQGFASSEGQPLATTHIRRPEKWGYMSGGVIAPNGWSWRNLDVGQVGPGFPWTFRANWTHSGDVLSTSNPGHSNFLFGDLHAESVNRGGESGRSLENTVYSNPTRE